MIGSVFTYQKLSKDLIFCYFLKIWAPIFVRLKVVTDLKNALYYPLNDIMLVSKQMTILSFKIQCNEKLYRKRDLVSILLIDKDTLENEFI